MSDGECRFTVKLHWLDYQLFSCSFCVALFPCFFHLTGLYGITIKIFHKNVILHLRPNFTSPPLSRQAIRGRSAKTLSTSYDSVARPIEQPRPAV